MSAGNYCCLAGCDTGHRESSDHTCEVLKLNIYTTCLIYIEKVTMPSEDMLSGNSPYSGLSHPVSSRICALNV